MLIERPIPRTGETLPVIGLGTWQTFDVGRDQYTNRAALLRRFVELGGRLIDSSPMYGRSEEVVGELAATLEGRDRLFLATKVWTHGQRAGARQMERSFEKLQIGQIDLMQVHNLVDADAHLETLIEWKAAGRIRYLGVTHYAVDAHPRLEPFLRRREIDFVQVNYSLAVRAAERRLLPMALELGVATVINRPFESGAMFSRASKIALPGWASDIGCTTWAHVFLKYVVSHPAVTCAIPATANVSHLEDNMTAGTGLVPDKSLRQAIARTWDAA